MLGPSSLLLVLLMMCAVVTMGAFVVGVGRLMPTPAPEPVTTPAPAAIASVSTPVPQARVPSSVAPSVTPIPPAVAPDVLRVALGDPAPVVERGQQVGTVTVESADYRPRIQGVDAPAGRRWLRVSLRFEATGQLTYEGSRLSALDANGRRHRWTRPRAPDPVLGTGTLDAGGRRTGYLVFSVPADVATLSLVLRDADARDIVVLSVR